MKRRPARSARRRVFRSPVEPGSISVNWKWVGFLLPLVGVIGTAAVLQYQVRDQQQRDADKETRLRRLELLATDQNAAVLTRLESRQEQLLVDMARVKARLNIDR